jgi:N-acetylglucosamine malate deacetylase 1
MKTLVVAPHLDDEAVSCGGLILDRVAKGGKVHVLALHGRFYGPASSKDQRASDMREADDFEMSLKVLGCTGRPCFLTEGEPGNVGFYTPLRYIESALKEFGPDEVVIPGETDLNQDHRHIHHLCGIALRPVNLGAVRRILAFTALDGRPSTPNYFVTMSLVDLDRKLCAINCYRRERREVPSPRAEANVVAQSKVWGAAAGVEYA